MPTEEDDATRKRVRPKRSGLNAQGPNSQGPNSQGPNVQGLNAEGPKPSRPVPPELKSPWLTAVWRMRRFGYELALAGLIVSLTAGWLVLRPPTGGLSPSPITNGSIQGEEIIAADEATILDARSPALQVFRFSAEPAVLVLSFPTLRQQGQMLDRIGAFVEKSGLPHERVLDDAELDAAIRQAGETTETYYYGHDYSSTDLARFFATALRDGIALNPEELRLHRLLAQEGFLSSGAVGAVISIPPEMETPPIDSTARATILRHELSHGLYFTEPAYAAYARSFWETVLNDGQRAGFRHFLGSNGYDTANEDLMLNETQAYLAHTADRRYFRPDLAGLTAMDGEHLRQAFLLGMPDGWLKRATR